MDAYIAISIALIFIDITLLYALSKMKRINRDLEEKIIKLTSHLGIDSGINLSKPDDDQQARKLEIIGRLAIGIAHDFNNILQVINGQTELMLNKHSEDSDIVGNLRTILIAGERGASLARQLLVFTRKKETELKPVDINNVIKPMKRMLERVIGENIALDVHFNPRCSMVMADEVLIEEIIMNLTVNARDAMLFGGRITVQMEDVTPDSDLFAKYPEAEPRQYLKLSVQDEGEGIPEDVIPHIFEPFFTTKAENKGTGLGLATVYGITRQLGGFIQVKSKLGIGTTFHIYLPSTEERRTETESTPEVFEECEIKHKKILILEDDAMVNRLIYDVIKCKDVDVYSVYDLAEARDVWKDRKDEIDLIIADIILPDGNGPELIKEFIDGGMTIPFIFISGYTEDKMQVSRIINKEHFFLQKPFTVPQLKITVSKALAGEVPTKDLLPS
jgi:signal transduction histidine kinase/CheY-like chemotaxis protein